MAETKKEATGQEPSTKTADTKKELAVQEPSTRPVIDLLTGILSEVQRQVQSKQPKPLEGLALQAVDLFREIVVALALQPPPTPTITLTASPAQLAGTDKKTTLTWSSTNAQRVSIDPGVGEVTPAAGGSKEVPVPTTTTFKATATGLCGSSAADTFEVTVD